MEEDPSAYRRTLPEKLARMEVASKSCRPRYNVCYYSDCARHNTRYFIAMIVSFKGISPTTDPDGDDVNGYNLVRSTREAFAFAVLKALVRDVFKRPIPTLPFAEVGPSLMGSPNTATARYVSAIIKYFQVIVILASREHAPLRWARSPARAVPIELWRKMHKMLI